MKAAEKSTASGTMTLSLRQHDAKPLKTRAKAPRFKNPAGCKIKSKKEEQPSSSPSPARNVQTPLDDILISFSATFVVAISFKKPREEEVFAE